MAGTFPSHFWLGEHAAVFPIGHFHYDNPDRGEEKWRIETRQIAWGSFTQGRLTKPGELGHYLHDYKQYGKDFGDMTGWLLWEVKNQPDRWWGTIRHISASITNENVEETFGNGSIQTSPVFDRNWTIDTRFKGNKTEANPVWHLFPENDYFTANIAVQDESECRDQLAFTIDPRIIANNSPAHSSIVAEYETDKRALSRERVARVMGNWRVAHDGKQFLPAYLGDDLGAGGFFPMWGQGDGAGNQTTTAPAGGRKSGLFAWGDYVKNGTFHLGHQTNDKHKLGTNIDGEAINPLHNQKFYLVYENIIKDGPYKYSFFLAAQPRPRIARVHHEYNFARGVWDWHCEVPELDEPLFPLPKPNDKIPLNEFPNDFDLGVPSGSRGPVIHPSDSQLVGGPSKGQDLVPTGDGSGKGIGAADLPRETKMHSMELGAGRDKTKQGYDGGFGPTTLGGNDVDYTPDPDLNYSPPGFTHDQVIDPSSDPFGFDPTLTEAPEGFTHDQPIPVTEEERAEEAQRIAERERLRRAREDAEFERQLENPTADDFTESAIDPELAERKKKREDFYRNNPGKSDPMRIVGPPSYGKPPSTMRLTGIAPVKADGTWQYLPGTAGLPLNQGGVWRDGLPNKSAAYFTSAGYLIDGPDDMSDYLNDFTLGLYDGYKGGNPAIIAWGTPDQDNGTVNGGPTITATGSVGSQNLAISSTDSDGVERTVRTSFNGQILTTNNSITDPAYTFSDDDDTGIYRIGTNQLGFVAGGDNGAGSRGAVRLTTALFGPTGGEYPIDLGGLTAPWGDLYCNGGTFNSDVTVNGKLTVTGMIDPTALVLTEQSADPWTPAAGYGSLWVKNNAPSALRFTNDLGVVHRFGGYREVVTSTITVANTTTATTIFSASIEANSWTIGRILKVRLSGYYSNASTSDDFTINIKLNGDTHTINRIAGNVTNQGWTLEYFITCYTVGVTGLIYDTAWFSDGLNQYTANETTGHTIDMTDNLDLIFEIQWDNEKVGNTFTITQGWVEGVN